MESLEDIRKWVVKPSLLDLAQSLQPAMQGDIAAQQQVCGALLWTAFAAPGAVTEVYDAIAAGAAGEALDSTSWQAEECAIPVSFWETFAGHSDRSRTGLRCHNDYGGCCGAWRWRRRGIW